MNQNLLSRLSITGWWLFGIGITPVTSQASGQEQSGERYPGIQIIGTKPGSWRRATVFTHAIWRDILFYGGGAGMDGGDPRHEIEIGAFHLGEIGKRDLPSFGTQNPGNPIITRAQFGLDQPGKGITPLSILQDDDRLYMFCTSRPDDDLNPRIVVITASVDQPLQWGGYTVVIDEALSGCRNNHGASVIVNPDQPTEVLVYFAACTPPNGYRILLATVPLEGLLDSDQYELRKSYADPVLQRENAKTNYPFVRYLPDRREFEMWYSGHLRSGSPARACFVTRSKHNDFFAPAERPSVSPSGVAGRDDRAYTTAPKVHDGSIYYSGRSDYRGDYVGIFRVDGR